MGKTKKLKIQAVSVYYTPQTKFSLLARGVCLMCCFGHLHPISKDLGSILSSAPEYNFLRCRSGIHETACQHVMAQVFGSLILT